MFTNHLLLDRYEDLHKRLIPNYIEAQPELVLKAQLPGFNPVLWIYWHMVRTEDAAVSRFVLGKQQVYAEYGDVCGAPTSYNGTGMTMEEVIDTTEALSLEGIKAYRAAVYSRTMSVLDSRKEADFSAIIPDSLIRKVICDEGLMPQRSHNMLPMYFGKSKEWFLLHVCLTHPFYHLGQITSALKVFSHIRPGR